MKTTTFYATTAALLVSSPSSFGQGGGIDLEKLRAFERLERSGLTHEKMQKIAEEASQQHYAELDRDVAAGWRAQIENGLFSKALVGDDYSKMGVKLFESGRMKETFGSSQEKNAQWNLENWKKYRDHARASVTWSGETSVEGYATGSGTLTWHKDDSPRWTYSGTMTRGKLTGLITNRDHDGNRGAGRYRKGKKAGVWNFTSASGRKWTKDYGNSNGE